jgi:hypothetical protein
MRDLESSVTGETMLDAYWQTLCTGMALGDGFEAGKNAFTFSMTGEVLTGGRTRCS